MTLAIVLKALAGGILIGVASALMLYSHGKIAGISGILSGALHRPLASDGWRLWFLGGLVAGGLLLFAISPSVFTRAALDTPRDWSLLLGAGLLVGFGTRLSHGCTSGHGVCGIGRGYPRSIAATVTFVGVGVATMALFKAVHG